MIEKKGSRGGNARRAKLSKEQRSAIAKAGARARWDKKKAENTTITYVNSQTGETSLPSPTTELVPVVEIDPIPVIPAEPTPAEKGRMRALKEKPVSKVYGKALEIANKDYEEAAEALAYHEEMVARLTSKMPRLIKTIRALGGTIETESMPLQSTQPLQQMVRPTLTTNDGPSRPIAAGMGGAIGGIPEDMMEDDPGPGDVGIAGDTIGINSERGWL
jgi:hypothetical protein